MKRLNRVNDFWIESLGIIAQCQRMLGSGWVCALNRATVARVSAKRDWKSAEASTNRVALEGRLTV